MAVEAGHIQLTEYSKEVIPKLNYMMEDLFCRYGVSIPYYLLDFSFPDYPLNAEWPEEYTPEFLELYRPGMPPWPEMPWWNIPDWQLPEMRGPKFPWVEWPRLPDMPWPDIPDWPEWEIPEWERPELYWPEWDWPEWEEPESEDKRKRRRRKKLIELITEVHKTKQISVGITPPKPPIDLTNWYDEITNGFNFNVDQGEFGYDLPWFNELIGLLFDEADLPRLALPDFSPQSIAILNNEITAMYEAVEVSADYTFSVANGLQVERIQWHKTSVMKSTWADAWSEMEAATPEEGNLWYTRFSWYYYNDWYLPNPPSSREWYGANKQHSFFSYDTSSLAGKTVTTAKLRFMGMTSGYGIDVEEYADTLEVYQDDWGDTITASDWEIDGELSGSIANADIIDAGSPSINDVDLDISHINTTGVTQFKVATKADVEGYEAEDPIQYGRDSGFNTVGGGIFTPQNGVRLIVTATG